VRLAALHIDGFGIFQDLDISGLSPGLNLFLGENESGKSTLLTFIRTILFGFPPGQRRENPYPPLAGGRHGGRLTLGTRDGERYVVTRHQGRKRGPVTVTLPGGSQGDEEVLRQLTGAASEDLFRSIFAFSLSELESFDSLNDQAVRAAIYSAGAGVGRVSLAQVEKRLEASLGQLFKPGGKNPIINTLFRELEEINLNMRQRLEEVAKYDELRAELRQVAAVLEEKKKHLAAGRRRFERVTFLERAWEDWVNFCRLREELAELPEIEIFPADAVKQLETLQERLRLLKVQLAELSLGLEQTAEGLAGLEVQSEWLAAAEEIRVLERGLERFSASRHERMELEPRLKLERLSLEDGLKTLGQGWRKENLEQFNGSISAREEVRRHQETLEQNREAVAQAERGFAHAAGSLERAGLRDRETEAALSRVPEPKEKDPEALVERRMGLRTLRNLVQLRLGLLGDLEQLGDRQEDLAWQRAQASQQLGEVGPPPLWPAAAVALVSLAGGLAAGWRGDWFTGLSVGAGGLLITLVVVRLLMVQRQRLRGQADLWEEQIREAEGKEDSLRAREERCRAEIAANDQEAAGLAQTTGFSALPTLEEVDRALSQVETDQEALHRWQPVRQRHLESMAEIERCRKELAEAEKALAGKQGELLDSEQGWGNWLSDTGLAENLSPGGALEVMERVRSLRQQARTLADLEQRQQLLELSVNSYVEKVAEVARRLQATEILAEDPALVVQHLVGTLERNEQEQRRREVLERRVADYQAQLEQTSAQISAEEKSLQGLFTEGGADDEAQFRRRAHLYERRSRVKEAMEQHLRNLENLGGRGEDLGEFQRELQKSSPERLRGEREELGPDIHSLEEQLAGLQERHGGLTERCGQIESTEELAVLREQRNALMTELADAARQWSGFTLCLHFLHQARQIYEKERKQPVVRESEHFFRTMTGGRYLTIVAPPGEERLQVVGADDRSYELQVLSRGTAEQLYLSLRFGYIQEFSRRARPLPVIMDDILVNFDPQRARAAARTILELAGQNQVLFFTCHPETAALIREVYADVPVWRLHAGGCRREPE
jgi:uncharacterized protein YhaN